MNLTKEIKQILNNFAFPATMTKGIISEGFIRDTEGKFEKIAIAINEMIKNGEIDVIQKWERWKIENGKYPEYRTKEQLLNDYLNNKLEIEQ